MNNNNNPNEPLKGRALLLALHQEYCARTAYDLVLNGMRENTWRDWITYNREQPFTVEDLKLVIAYLRVKIRASERNEGALRFRNLIGNPDYFEEDLQQAKKWQQENGKRWNPGSGRTKAKVKEETTSEDDERVSLEELEAMKREAGLAKKGHGETRLVD